MGVGMATRRVQITLDLNWLKGNAYNEQNTRQLILDYFLEYYGVFCNAKVQSDCVIVVKNLKNIASNDRITTRFCNFIKNTFGENANQMVNSFLVGDASEFNEDPEEGLSDEQKSISNQIDKMYKEIEETLKASGKSYEDIALSDDCDLDDLLGK